MTAHFITVGQDAIGHLARIAHLQKHGLQDLLALFILHERDDPELDADAESILETVGLAGFGQAFPHELSGGMRHRAAFARALITRPSLLLMDEPFGALDAITRTRMHEFLLRVREEFSMTIVFVTHDIEEAVLLGDRIAVMGGQPPGIDQIIDVPLRRPRQTADVDTPEFLAVKRAVRTTLED